MHAQFVLSAASAADFPQTGIPEIALVGRSNVGKSSLINALTKLKIARTSAAPGKTRLANYYLIPRLRASDSDALRRGAPKHAADRDRHAKAANPKSPIPEFYLVDLPGYGYARGGDDSVQAFEALTRQYFDVASSSRRLLAGVLQLIDARHPALKQDAAAFEWLQQAGIPTAVVATKIDKLTRAELAQHIRTLHSGLGVDPLPVSSSSGQGLDTVWKHIRMFLAAT